MRFHPLTPFQMESNFKTGYTRQTLTNFHDLSLAILLLPTFSWLGFYIQPRGKILFIINSRERICAYHRYALFCKLLHRTQVSVITNFLPFTFVIKKPKQTKGSKQPYAGQGKYNMDIRESTSYNFRCPTTASCLKNT